MCCKSVTAETQIFKGEKGSILHKLCTFVGCCVHVCVCAVVTVCAELMAYPIDTVRRRMMMTSGEAVKYSGAIDATMQIVRKEGSMALMRGAG